MPAMRSAFLIQRVLGVPGPLFTVVQSLATSAGIRRPTRAAAPRFRT
jgi:hypothetical protein